MSFIVSFLVIASTTSYSNNTQPVQDIHDGALTMTCTCEMDDCGVAAKEGN